MAEIQYFPIFNQAVPGIWQDFVHIRAIATENDGKMVWTSDVRDHAMNEYRKEWHKKDFNFAFGAWDGDEMIAFARGDIEGGIGFIRDLYVLPEYQHMKIGGTLLRMSERALALRVKYCDLVTRQNSKLFYMGHGYSSLTGTEELIKNISHAGKCATVPVFQCMPGLARKCKQIVTNYDVAADANAVNKHQRGMFVYLDSESKMMGFAMTHNNETDVQNNLIAPGIYVTNKLSAAKSCLNSALKNYAKFPGGR